MEFELQLRIVLEKAPAGVAFGLQKGAGSNYETILKQRSEGKDLCFEFSIRVKEGKTGSPVFAGPFAQGTPTERFLYIDIGTCAGQLGSIWQRRLKIPLMGITEDALKQSMADPSLILTARVPGTGRDGGPTCGTVKPFDGWKLVSR